MEEDARERFARLAAAPDDAVDLAEAALWIAAEEYPGLDVPGYLGRLRALAEAARPWLGASRGAERIARLNYFLFVQSGFAGNREHYHDPRNSFLNEVLDRRTGIPITLALVYMEVARRLGMEVEGIGFPGHFLAAVGSEPSAIVDPFFGRVLSAADCEQRLRAVQGPDAVLMPEVHLRAATSREMLVRMLSNLKLVYVRENDFERALACCDRILLLLPDAPWELRDRGLVYEQLECFAAAAADLRRYLELAPDDATAGPVREHLQALERRTRLH